MQRRFLILLILFLPLSAVVQEQREIEISAQTILARVDAVMQYPNGEMRGRIKHVRPDGRAFAVSVDGAITREDFLFTFSSRDRGEQLKVLYNLGGEDIWVYRVHALRLHHKMGIDKYDTILGTNFTFLDLSNADLQSNYTARIAGESVIKGIEAYRLDLEPIFEGGLYGLLTLYVDKKELIPLRIDYHDTDKAITKFLVVAKVKQKGNRIVPVRYDMMNIREGTVSILSFDDFDESVTFDASVFRSETLGE